MNSVATAIGSMFPVSSGEAVATCPKAPQTKGKAAKQVFADTAPLARLRDEVRSNKRLDSGSGAQETEVNEREPEVSEAQTDSVERGPAVEGRQPKPRADAGDPVDEEVVPLAAVVQPAVEGMVEADPVPGETEAAGTSLPVEGEVSDGSEPEETGQIVTASEQREGDAVAHTASENSQVLDQTEVGTKMATDDGQVSPARVEAEVAVAETGAEGSNEVLPKGEGASDPLDVQSPLPATSSGAEEPKATTADQAHVAVKQQSYESTNGEPKVAAQSSVMSDPAKPAETETVVKPQTQVQPEAQPLAEGAKTVDSDKVSVTSREPQVSERSADAMRQEDAKSFSQQDSGTRSQPQGPVQTVAASKPEDETTASTSKQPLQPEMELTAASQDGATEASPRLSAQAANPAGLDAAGVRSPVQDVGQQILDSVHASMTRADKQIQIRLDPPELGTVTVRIAEQGDQIQGILQVSRDDTRREIEQALPQVLKGLQDAGIQVRRLEVVVSDQPDRGSGRDQLQQDAWAHQQQQQNSDQGYRPQNTAATNWSARRGFPQSPAGLDGPGGSQAQGSQDRIDMLM